MQKSDVWFVIPAYNESRSIERVVTTLRSAGYTKIIVVDDCSKDNTLQIISSLPVVALHHAINRGQGAALRTGTSYFLRKTTGKYLIHFDGDGQHRVEDISTMLAPLEQGFEVTTGSRFLQRQSIQSVPKSKRLLLRVSVLVNFLLYGIQATDAHNGFRAFTRRGASRVQFKEDRMEHASEIAEIITKKRMKHKEVPVIIDYHEYGQNVFHAIKIGMRLILRKLVN